MKISPPGAPEVFRKRLERWPVGARYLTFSCYHRLPLLGKPAVRDEFVRSLVKARARCGFRLYGWVVMPEHVHLILRPAQVDWPVERILVAIKQPVAQRVLRRWRELDAPVLQRLVDALGRTCFWQPGGGFDRSVRDAEEYSRELAYIHNNPVKRGLVGSPTEWIWSSAGWYEGLADEPALDVRRRLRRSEPVDSTTSSATAPCRSTH
jgi:putative transposase